MRNFHKLCSGLAIGPLLIAIARQPELWNQNTLRTSHPQTPHQEVSDIWLRFQDMNSWKDKIEEGKKLSPESDGELLGEYASAFLDEHESVNYPALALLPQARQILFDLMRLVEGERLGRVLITRLPPGKRIHPHRDGGSHAAYYDRYHVALQVLPGAIFSAGPETIQMQPGDVWWFDNSQEHEVVNNSADDRIVMIVDIRSQKGS